MDLSVFARIVKFGTGVQTRGNQFAFFHKINKTGMFVAFRSSVVPNQNIWRSIRYFQVKLFVGLKQTNDTLLA